MNVIDVALLGVIIVSVLSGWQRGFITGAVSLAVWVGSLIIGFLFYQRGALFLNKFVTLGVWLQPLSFILTTVLARLLLSAVLGRIITQTPKSSHEHSANKALGILPGLANGLINATVMAALLLAVPLLDGLSDKTRESKLANYFVAPAEWLEKELTPVFGDAVQRSLNKLTVAPESKETIKLPYTVKAPKVREDLEAKMLDMVNKERAREGLKPLRADPEMAEVARAHSRDMFARGYFAHVNPDGKDPFDRIRAARVRFRAAGENLALAQTLTIAHNGLMNSPGHRANILQPSFGRLGIGILDGGMYGLMITQNFRN